MNWVQDSAKSTTGEVLPSDTDGSTIRKYGPTDVPSLGGGSSFDVPDIFARINNLAFSGYAYSTAGVASPTSPIPTFGELTMAINTSTVFRPTTIATLGVSGYPHGTYWPVATATCKHGGITNVNNARGLYLISIDISYTQIDNTTVDGTIATTNPITHQFLLRYLPAGLRRALRSRPGRYNNRIQYCGVIEINEIRTGRVEVLQNYFTNGTVTIFKANCTKFSLSCLYRYI